MGRLVGYFQGGNIDSEGQLRAAQSKARAYSPAEDRRAKAAGFPSADAMTVYLNNKKHKVGGSVPAQKPMLDMGDLLAWHPANTIGMAADALDYANKR